MPRADETEGPSKYLVTLDEFSDTRHHIDETEWTMPPADGLTGRRTAVVIDSDGNVHEPGENAALEPTGSVLERLSQPAVPARDQSDGNEDVETRTETEESGSMTLDDESAKLTTDPTAFIGQYVYKRFAHLGVFRGSLWLDLGGAGTAYGSRRGRCPSQSAHQRTGAPCIAESYMPCTF